MSQPEEIVEHRYEDGSQYYHDWKNTSRNRQDPHCINLDAFDDCTSDQWLILQRNSMEIEEQLSKGTQPTKEIHDNDSDK